MANTFRHKLNGYKRLIIQFNSPIQQDAAFLLQRPIGAREMTLHSFTHSLLEIPEPFSNGHSANSLRARICSSQYRFSATKSDQRIASVSRSYCRNTSPNAPDSPKESSR